MYYPDEVVQEVREKSDIVTVISRYVTLQKKGHNYFGLCPFHSEKTPSFSVNGTDQFYHCFGCGAGGNVFSFLQNVENLSFVEALEQLAAENNVTLPKKEMDPREKARLARREQMYEACRDAARFYYAQLVGSPQAENARKYLEKRQVTEPYLKKFGLGYAPISRGALTQYLLKKGYPLEMLKSLDLASGRESAVPGDVFFNRVMFPIFDVKGRVIAFGGRVLGDGMPKYLNSRDTELFNKRKNLYAMQIARKSRRKQALLAEGYMDVFSLHQAGFDNAVASLGTALTPEQALLIRRYFEEVCIVYDSDGAGTNAARRAIPILEQVGLRVRVIRVPGAKDPDDFIKAEGAEAFEKLIEGALDPVDFELAVRDRSTLEAQVETLNVMRERLMNIADDAERELHIRDVARRLEINPETLGRQVEEARRMAGTREIRQARDWSRNRRKEGGLARFLKELEAIMLRYPELRGVVLDYLPPEDLRLLRGEQSGTPENPPGDTEESALDLYLRVYTCFEERFGQELLTADMISLSDDPKEQELLAEIAAFPLPEKKEEVLLTAQEIVRSLRLQVLDRRLTSAADIAAMQTVLKEKKAAEVLQLKFE